MGEFKMPSLGSQMIDARLVKWLVKTGDTVRKGDIIGEIDTEKGLIDVEAFESGVIRELRAQEGEVIPVGSVMAVIESEGEGKDKRAEKKEEIVESVGEAAEKHSEVAKTDRKNGRKKPASKKDHIKASPLARRVAEDLNVDLSNVEGSGSGGVIHRKDVELYAGNVKAEHAAREEMELASKVSEAETGKEPKSMRRAIAAAMSRSNSEIPHYYLESEIDMKASMDWLEETNSRRPISERLMPPVLLVKAAADALTEVPLLNGFWTDEAMHIEEGVHIGFAISLRQGGLVIPAIRNADLKSLDEIREEFVDMVMRAREGHLKSREISSATITITSLGERGAEKVFGVIYPPQVALLGLGKITRRPRVVDDSIGIRPVITAVLAGDHRATDGQTGSRFLEIFYEKLQHPEEL